MIIIQFPSRVSCWEIDPRGAMEQMSGRDDRVRDPAIVFLTPRIHVSISVRTFKAAGSRGDRG